MKFWGNLIPVDVFASDVAKMLPGSNFLKVSEARNAKTLARIKFPPKFLKSWHLWEVRGP